MSITPYNAYTFGCWWAGSMALYKLVVFGGYLAFGLLETRNIL
jgi:hypothetical protein